MNVAHPLEVADHESVEVPTFRQADEMNRRDVRGEEGRADDGPAKGAPRKEVDLARQLHAPHGEQADRENPDEIDHDHDEVDQREAQAADFSRGVDQKTDPQGIGSGGAAR